MWLPGIRKDELAGSHHSQAKVCCCVKEKKSPGSTTSASLYLSLSLALPYIFNFHVNGEHDYIFKAANDRVYTLYT